MINIFQKFKDGLKKTTSNFSKGIKDIVVNKEIDDKTLEEIEEFLIQSDVGVEASSEIRQQIANSRIDPSKNKLDEINKILKEYINIAIGIPIIEIDTRYPIIDSNQFRALST